MNTATKMRNIRRFMSDRGPEFHADFECIQAAVHQTAEAIGWWEKPPADGTVIALIHEEVSEALRSLREGEPASEKIEGFTRTEEELADVVLRIMDYAGWRNLRLADAILAKARFNTRRERKHGGLAF